MSNNTWMRELAAAVTVCDADGVILEMNDSAIRQFEKDGGAALLRTNILDCHPEPARTKLSDLMRERRTNCYTTSKAGVYRFIYQAPWFRDGEYAGILEISFEIPEVVPHFNRD